MTKNLVEAKIAQRVELEYQLAAKKADFAQAESERIMYEVGAVCCGHLFFRVGQTLSARCCPTLLWFIVLSCYGYEPATPHAVHGFMHLLIAFFVCVFLALLPF